MAARRICSIMAADHSIGNGHSGTRHIWHAWLGCPVSGERFILDLWPPKLDEERLNTPHPSTIGKIRLKLNEGLTGWVARERRLWTAPLK